MSRSRSADAHGSTTVALSGLATAWEGLTLSFERTRLPVGTATNVRFRVLDETGDPVEEFEREGGVLMHLIVVRRDLTGFQHLHPTVDEDGTFSTSVTLPAAGAWRAFADFEHEGRKTVLGVDLQAAGAYVPEPLPAASSHATTGEYRVELASAAPHAGREGDLEFRVTRAGMPVEPGPYLGARGHLVALREGDLGYLHVHPLADATAGTISFAATFPSSGRYRLFLQFDHGGRIHTAALTLQVPR